MHIKKRNVPKEIVNAKKIKYKQKIDLSMPEKNNGITLIALVLTIAIIIILSTITINVVLGDDGLLEQVLKTRNRTSNTISNEEASMNIELQKYANTMAEESEIPDPVITFKPQETPEPESGGSEFTMTYGVIEIKWLDETSYNVSNTPNPPKIKQNLPEGTTMELVKYDEASQEWVSGIEYSYEEGTGIEDNNQSKWANAKVTIDEVESYFVWIPRYAYRIVYFRDEPSKNEYKTGAITEEEAIAQGKLVGYSDSRGIVTADGKRVDSVTSESNTTRTMVSEDYFMTHPAFLDGTNTGFENGEWDKELEGIWVGKYESARSNATETSGGSGTIIKVQPGAQSFTGGKIGDMYTYAREYSQENLKSHMLKNSEWGAVAYLTESTYGRNGTEIEYNGTMITGGGTEKTYIENAGQSSTGNVYGIYDLRGGATEYVVGYYDGGSTLANGSSFVDDLVAGYSTAYSGTDSIMSYRYGDATFETSGWHSDASLFVNSSYPFFLRGGGYFSDNLLIGVFCYSIDDGNGRNNRSFRIAIIV